MRTLPASAVLLVGLLVGAPACSQPVDDLRPLGEGPISPPAAAEPREVAMTNARLDELLRGYFSKETVEGQAGMWRIRLKEPPVPQAEADEAEQAPGAGDRLPAVVVVMTDARADRMRVMMPIREFDPERVEDLQLALIALHANYDRALDARYAIQDGVLWSVFIHPLGSLTEQDLTNAIDQVRSLRRNTGTTYSSSDLFFAPGIPGEPPERAAPSSDDPSAA